MSRSAAEAEIRNAVVERLRRERPDARICHEVNIEGGSNRVDVMAVTPTEIISVEVKSEKDKMDRALAQIAAMKLVSHHSVIAIHECHLIEQVTNEYCSEYCKSDGLHYLRKAPPEAKGALVWVYPERERGEYAWETGTWRSPERRFVHALPSAALDLLWRDELHQLCCSLRVSVGRRANMTEMITALRWMCNGRELTLGICAALRGRKFAEADSPVVETARDGASLLELADSQG